MKVAMQRDSYSNALPFGNSGRFGQNSNIQRYNLSADPEASTDRQQAMAVQTIDYPKVLFSLSPEKLQFLGIRTKTVIQ